MRPSRSFLFCLKQSAHMDLASAETRTLIVDAQYGRYQLVIGPEYSAKECSRRQLPRYSRPIEISGTVDHLFIHGDQISPSPARDEVEHHLQGTVVIHGVSVHLYDRDGNGVPAPAEPLRQSVVIAETINLAGSMGEEWLQHWQANGRLAYEVYRIVQRDILRAFEKHGVYPIRVRPS